jgi:hypothetical protein
MIDHTFFEDAAASECEIPRFARDDQARIGKTVLIF